MIKQTSFQKLLKPIVLRGEAQREGGPARSSGYLASWQVGPELFDPKKATFFSKNMMDSFC